MQGELRRLRVAARILVIFAWLSLVSSWSLALFAIVVAVLYSSTDFPLRFGVAGALLIAAVGAAFFLLLYAIAIVARLIVTLDQLARQLGEQSDDRG